MKEETLVCPSCQHPQRDNEASFCAKCRFPLMLIAGKYRLLRKLGEGGFGFVYLAEHIRLQKEAERVIKIIKPEVFSQSPSSQLRFEREVQMTSLLSQKCQHIVRIHDDFGEVPELGYFYVMEYLQGKPISSFIKDPNALPPISWCVHVFAQLCDAMRRAHEDGIIHRDLKPDNLMLIHYGDEPHYLKVIDFGIAKPLEEQAGGIITQGFVGTPIYMAPELFSDSKKVNFQVDIYAMAVILYEMLGGKPPFFAEGNARTSFFKMFQSHINETPPSLREIRPDRNISIQLEEAVMRGLQKDPDDRYPSAMAFKEAILQASQKAPAFFSPMNHVPLNHVPFHAQETATGNLELATPQPRSSLTPLPMRGNLRTPQPFSPTVLPSQPELVSFQSANSLRTPSPQAFPTGDVIAPTDSLSNQQAVNAPMLSSGSFSTQKKTNERSKSKTIILTMIGVFGGLLLGALFIYLFRHKPTKKPIVVVTKNHRLPPIHPTPSSLKNAKRNLPPMRLIPTKKTVKVFKVKVAPQNMTQPQEKREKRASKQHYHRSHRISRQQCHHPPRGMGWSFIRTSRRRVKIKIIAGKGRIQKMRGHKMSCLWFKGHHVVIRLQAPRMKPCSFKVLRLHKRIVTELKSQNTTPNSPSRYCRKL